MTLQTEGGGWGHIPHIANIPPYMTSCSGLSAGEFINHLSPSVAFGEGAGQGAPLGEIFHPPRLLKR